MESKPVYPQSAIDWQPYQAEITRLYRDENHSLKEVQRLMEMNFRFRATEKMYKRKFKLWRLDKNHKAHEVLEILRLQGDRAAQGKQSKFMLRGRVVDMDDLQRYLKRKKIDPQEQPMRPLRKAIVNSGTNDQVMDLVCRTPSPSPCVTNPGGVLDKTERFCLIFNQYLLGSIEAGAWTVSDDSPWLRESEYRSENTLKYIQLGKLMFDYGQHRQAMHFWRLASAQMEILARSWSYDSLFHFIDGVALLTECDVAVAQIFLRHLGELVSPLPASETPQKAVLQSLSQLNATHFQQLFLSTYRWSLSIFKSQFRNNEDFLVFQEARLADSESNTGEWTHSPRIFDHIEARLHSDGGQNSTIRAATERLARALLKSERVDEAEYLLSMGIKQLESSPEQPLDLLEDLLSLHALRSIALRYSGKEHEAYQTCLLAIDICERVVVMEASSLSPGRAEQVLLNQLRAIIELESNMGLLEEAEAHKTRLASLEAAIDGKALKQLVEQGLADT